MCTEDRKEVILLYKYSIVACARWETQYISEWITYYDYIGFDHIYLYCNDDDPRELQAQVQATPTTREDLVSFTHFHGQGRQVEMYLDAMARVRRESEWVAFLDIDEFLALPGSNSIHTFMQDFSSIADSVHFNWRMFGNNGFVTRPSGNVLRLYTKCAAGLDVHTKHLTRARFLSDDKLRSSSFPFWHGLADPEWSHLRRVNVLGADISSLMVNNLDAANFYLSNPNIKKCIEETAVINHYAFKSEEDFILREQRGIGGEFSGQITWKQQFDDGSFRQRLEQVNCAEETYLCNLSRANLPEIGNPVLLDESTGMAVRRLRVQHPLWTADLLLDGNGRLQHATHGTTGNYQLTDDVLHAKWDTYPADIFIRKEKIFVHVGLVRDGTINMESHQIADLGTTQLPVAAVVLQIPETDYLVEVRPGSSDVAVFRAIYIENEYAEPFLEAPVRTVFDLGANIGLATVYFALRFPEAQIIAVEPEMMNFCLLRRNTRSCPNVVPVHAAVWSSDTSLRLHTTDSSGNNLGDWGCQTEATTDQGNVTATSITSLIERYDVKQIDLLKIDIEGAELDLFSSNVDTWLRITRCIVIETHERFRAGSDSIVTKQLAADFIELEPSGEHRIFMRRNQLTDFTE